MKTLMCLGIQLILACAASSLRADEALVGLEKHSVPAGGHTIRIVAVDPVPPAIAARLEAINAVIASRTTTSQGPEEASTAPGGKALAIQLRELTPIKRSEILVWTDYASSAAPLVFVGDTLHWLSDHHFAIRRTLAPNTHQTVFIDMLHPTDEHVFKGFINGTVQISKAGRWAALAHTKSPFVGLLSADDPAWFTRARPLPTTRVVEGFQWMRGGDVLIAQERGADRVTKLVSYRFNGDDPVQVAEVTATVDFGWSLHQLSVSRCEYAGGATIIAHFKDAGNKWTLRLVDVAAAGTFTVRDASGNGLRPTKDMIYNISHSGRVALCKRDSNLIGLIGGVEYLAVGLDGSAGVWVVNDAPEIYGFEDWIAW